VQVRPTLKTLLLVLLLAIIPLRALATVTIGFCALHHPGAALSEPAHAHHHDGGNHQHGASHDTCDSCVEHCASASAVTSADLPSLPPTGAHWIASHKHFAPGFVPDPLDPPPLAS
jgi:hypothetical protein